MLQADTATRQKIFRQIFKTDKFEKTQQKLADKSSCLKRVCENNRDRVNGYIRGIECDESDMSAKYKVQMAKNAELVIDEIIELISMLIESDTELKTEAEGLRDENQKRLDEINAIIEERRRSSTTKATA